jgi:ribosomal protein L16/L10AE
VAEIGLRVQRGRLVAEALRRAARDLPVEIQKAMRDTAGPLIEAARQRARATLPRHGGLNEVVAASRFQTRPVRRGGEVGVRIQTADHDRRLDSQGRVRHPVYGRDRWVTQRVQPGWFTAAMTAAGKTAGGRRLERALQRVADEAGGGG